MRVAALYDIHGNLPALEAVLDEVEREAPDLVVVGGDVVAGPMPAQTLDRLLALGDRARFVRGNADREAVGAFDRGRPGDLAWLVARLSPAHRDALAAFEARVVVDADGLGPVLFCHGSPRSDEEMLTRITPEDRLAEVLDGVRERVVVGGHVHTQYDRRAAGRRLVNAGSVGLPYEGRPGAFWALLGPGVDLRRTQYDVVRAREAIRATGWPDADEALRESLLEPIDPGSVAEYFEGKVAEGMVVVLVPEAVRPLRARVLRPHQRPEEVVFDGDEAPDTLHAGALGAGRLVGVASVFRQGHPRDPRPGDWRLRGMATEPEVRGQGHGEALLNACVEHVRDHGGRRVWCNARTTVTGFYERFGFAAEGAAFDLPAIGPHVVMTARVGD